MGWLTSCDDDALAAGLNLAVLGSELVQFSQAVAIGEGQFRLSRLLRGRGGTEWACASHAPGDTFCLVQPATLQTIGLPNAAIGASVRAEVAGGSPTSVLFSAEGLRPLSPVNLRAQPQVNGDLLLNWIRRSRSGFAWIDEIDTPLGETYERYRVNIIAGANLIEFETAEPAATISAGTLAVLGAGPAIVAVRQIGDFAVSRPAEINITLP